MQAQQQAPKAAYIFDMDALKALIASRTQGGLAVVADAYAGFRRDEKKQVLAAILERFGPTHLCLAPCGVNSNTHPGLRACHHALAAVRDGGPREPCACGPDAAMPVCALPRELPHPTHFCCPDDRNRYVVCDACQTAVPVRAAKRHAEGHLGVNRKSPEELKAQVKADVARFLRLNNNHHAADQVAAGRWNPSGSWVRNITKGFGAANIKQMREALATAPKGHDCRAAHDGTTRPMLPQGTGPHGPHLLPDLTMCLGVWPLRGQGDACCGRVN